MSETVEGPRLLITYTRNPSVIKMIGRVCGGLSNIYPCTPKPALRDVAVTMQHAEEVDNIACHVNRYDSSGLFGAADPADRSLMASGPSLKAQFPCLASIRNAIIVVGEPSIDTGRSRK